MDVISTSAGIASLGDLASQASKLIAKLLTLYHDSYILSDARIISEDLRSLYAAVCDIAGLQYELHHAQCKIEDTIYDICNILERCVLDFTRWIDETGELDFHYQGDAEKLSKAKETFAQNDWIQQISREIRSYEAQFTMITKALSW